MIQVADVKRILFHFCMRSSNIETLIAKWAFVFRIVKPVVKPSASLLPTAVATVTSVTSSAAERPAAADATLTGEPPVSGGIALIDPGLECSCEMDSQCSTVRNSPLAPRSPFIG
jgi:hypothetical protein